MSRERSKGGKAGSRPIDASALTAEQVVSLSSRLLSRGIDVTILNANEADMRGIERKIVKLNPHSQVDTQQSYYRTGRPKSLELVVHARPSGRIKFLKEGSDLSRIVRLGEKLANYPSLEIEQGVSDDDEIELAELNDMGDEMTKEITAKDQLSDAIESLRKEFREAHAKLDSGQNQLIQDQSIITSKINVLDGKLDLIIRGFKLAPKE